VHGAVRVRDRHAGRQDLHQRPSGRAGHGCGEEDRGPQASIVTGTLGLLLATLVAAAGTATAAPTVSRFDDGSFEYPAVAANSFQSFATGASMGPWRVTSGAVDLIGAGFWQAAEGDQSLDLNATVPATVAQTFTTTSGKPYTVTYSLAGNPDGQSPLKTGRVLIDGQDFQDFSFDTTGKT